MFAKFSPDSRRVAYVRGNDLYVTELATGRATRLTADGSDDVINGTTDWVYEESSACATPSGGAPTRAASRTGASTSRPCRPTRW
jgi:hypothetical protein